MKKTVSTSRFADPLKSAENIDPLGLLSEILNFGYDSDYQKSTGLDLNSWDIQSLEGVITDQKDKFSDEVQRARINVIYKQPMELGSTSIPMMIIEIYRNLPVDRKKNPPSYSAELLGCPWKIKNIRYYSSLDKMHIINKIDFS